MEYEVIAGSRRWKACSDANIFLKAFVQDLSDEEVAIAQIKENQQLPICDYSKGMYYSKLIKGKTLTIAKLSESVGYSKAKIENFLSFERVPPILWETVGNLSRVSSRTAWTINGLVKKGKNYLDALLDLAEDIRKGMGSNLLEKKVMAAVHGYQQDLNAQGKIQLPSGQTIAIWTKQGLQFSKDFAFNKEDLKKALIDFFEKKSPKKHED
ncbi:ParB/RepB/Spo0J family partition protein [Candidatus Finniella inopinata]|uniref:ParB/RepB/Spo0J family partition protein n=1 Tax=Candidatus Finniella inopinata TaxID=1696036 RepID=A0A4Q7DHQ2_9PROT|nr:ParB/RepB/Spo0J family partition protein [Candidatus Finniella inopinata]RZI45454.1 ParB/RepB/Spo0J family partition protein [Candidatus Finniella inopinata]